MASSDVVSHYPQAYLAATDCRVGPALGVVNYLAFHVGIEGSGQRALDPAAHGAHGLNGSEVLAKLGVGLFDGNRAAVAVERHAGDTISGGHECLAPAFDEAGTQPISDFLPRSSARIPVYYGGRLQVCPVGQRQNR